MKNITHITAALLMSLSSVAATAASDTHAHSKATAPAKSADAKAPMTEGEIKKVDKEGGKVTIKHGEIKKLDMPGMTMVFRVKDPAMLDQLKAGDKINFSADNVDGKITLTAVEKAK